MILRPCLACCRRPCWALSGHFHLCFTSSRLMFFLAINLFVIWLLWTQADTLLQTGVRANTHPATRWMSGVEQKRNAQTTFRKGNKTTNGEKIRKIIDGRSDQGGLKLVKNKTNNHELKMSSDKYNVTKTNLSAFSLPVVAFLEAHQRKAITYDNFSFPEPYFITPLDRELFRKSSRNVEVLERMLMPEYFRGIIRVFRNGWASDQDDCGWKSDLGRFETSIPEGKVNAKLDIMCPLLVPEGCIFKHFMDGTLPKLIQAWDYVAFNEVVLLLPSGERCDQLSLGMLDLLGIPRNRVIISQGGVYPANYVINTCVTPPFHPALWRRARQLFRVPTPQPDSHDFRVVLFSRGYVANREIKLLNLKQVASLLKRMFTEHRVIVISHFLNDVTVARELFSKARIIITLPNDLSSFMLFAPRNATVIEIIGARRSGQVLPPSADQSTWQMATSMGHTYWRIYELLAINSGALSANLKKLKSVLSKVVGDGTTPGRM